MHTLRDGASAGHLLGVAVRVALAGALLGGAVALVANGVAMADQTATITDLGYDPQVVTIHAGESIVWTNTGSSAHTVTADDGSFDSGAIGPGQQWSVTLTEVGSFLFHSDAGGFHGRVDVLGIDVTHAPAASPTGSIGPVVIPPADASDPNATTILIVVAIVGVLVGAAYGYSRRDRLPTNGRR